MDMISNVTVVIPCYNDGEYIIQALNSILNQTLKPDKIIIIDDGSDIQTKNILESIKAESVQVIFQSNLGVCKTRNKGISLAKTDYILNLDADDFFEKTFIEKAVKILDENPNIGVVGCFYKVLKNTKPEQEIIKPAGGSLKNFLVKNNAMNCSMFRRICWEEASGYDEIIVNGYEDWDFWISILKNGWQMHIIQEALFTYRIKKSSRDISAFQDHDLELRSYIFNKHKQVYLDNFYSYVIQNLYENHKLKQNKLKVKNTLDYKIGSSILAPIRFIKRKIKFFK
ncbi:glycosyltransferase family A protein [Litoribaculum gwangyangense]|uniref:Glycosyltransferase family A protein n=1 Tax=Litoribaculum gwangyangense TaxID=1130722 RepID=A0ABP9CUA0_9FLAO